MLFTEVLCEVLGVLVTLLTLLCVEGAIVDETALEVLESVLGCVELVVLLELLDTIELEVVDEEVLAKVLNELWLELDEMSEELDVLGGCEDVEFAMLWDELEDEG